MTPTAVAATATDITPGPSAEADRLSPCGGRAAHRWETWCDVAASGAVMRYRHDCPLACPRRGLAQLRELECPRLSVTGSSTARCSIRNVAPQRVRSAVGSRNWGSTCWRGILTRSRSSSTAQTTEHPKFHVDIWPGKLDLSGWYLSGVSYLRCLVFGVWCFGASVRRNSPERWRWDESFAAGA